MDEMTRIAGRSHSILCALRFETGYAGPRPIECREALWIAEDHCEAPPSIQAA
jgi:hypothetical protein